MLILGVIIEYAATSLDRPFSYAYKGNKIIKEGIRVYVEFAHRKVVGYVVSVAPSSLNLEEYQQETGIKIKEIESIIDEEPLFNEELSLLSKKIASYYFAPLISVYQSMLPPSLKPKSSSLSKPKIAYESFYVPLSSCEEGLSAKQKELLRLINKEKEIAKKDISSLSVLKKLEEKNLVKEIKKEKIRLIQEDVLLEEYKELNDEQEKAFKEIVFGNDRSFLLEGVTGSGKTEVYLHASRELIKQGKSVLMLVPEISLTVQMVRRFKARFKKIAILHSGLTPSEKYDEYRRIAKGDVSIVVGARSAIFAPLKNIGLIIIDEEHSETYKQESSPFYNAITVAFMRQEYHNCKVVLGSATPSLETKIRALRGVYHQLYLKKRYNENELPHTEVIDMLKPSNIDTKSVILSLRLREEIQKNLQNKEQTLLLINRRGFAPFVTCRKCNRVSRCPTCFLPLTYHKEDKMLKCHHCGYVEEEEKECPKCGSTLFSKVGFGTEKVESEINALFPEAKTLRLDSDVTKIRTKASSIITSFEKEEADILIGTQMIAKGHDFKNVTLVGIVLADLGLNIPSFRSNERSFDLLTQAIGRAGRSTKKGRAIIQTYVPNNFVIYDAKTQDYNRFFNEEMANRKTSQYPPYVYCTMLTFSCKEEEAVKEAAIFFKKYLEAKFATKKVWVIGPSEPYLVVMNGKYRRKILLKYKNIEDIKEEILQIISLSTKNKKVQVTVDVDPYTDY